MSGKKTKKKQPDPPHERVVSSGAAEGSGTPLKFSDLKKTFAQPINQAAKTLRICPTVLKKLCRKFNIPRWPQRKVSCLMRLIAEAEKRVAGGDEAADVELVGLKKQLDQLIEHPETMNSIRLSNGSTSKAAGHETEVGEDGDSTETLSGEETEEEEFEDFEEESESRCQSTSPSQGSSVQSDSRSGHEEEPQQPMRTIVILPLPIAPSPSPPPVEHMIEVAPLLGVGPSSSAMDVDSGDFPILAPLRNPNLE